MLRHLQVVENKPIKTTFVTSAEMYQGMGVSLDFANSEIDKATGVGDYLVDIPKSYTGLYSIVNPEDDAFEVIASGANALVVPTYVGEIYATDQLTIGTLSVGDPLKVASGLFVAAAQGNSYQWIYKGTHSDPTGTMYKIERVALGTVA